MLDLFMTFEKNYVLVLDNIYPFVICLAVINELFELKIIQMVKGE